MPQMPGVPRPSNMPMPAGSYPPANSQQPPYPQPPAYGQPPTYGLPGAPPAMPGYNAPPTGQFGNAPPVPSYGGGMTFPAMPPPGSPPRPSNMPTNVPANAPSNVPPAGRGAAPTPAAPRPMPVPANAPVPLSAAPPMPPPAPPAPGIPPAAPQSPTTSAAPVAAPRPVPAGQPSSQTAAAAASSDDEEENVVDSLKKNSIPLGVSFLVHLILMLVLGLITIGRPSKSGILLDASLSKDAGESGLADVRMHSLLDVQPIDQPDDRPLFSPVEKVAVAVPVSPFGVGAVAVPSTSIDAPAALAGRGMKGALLGQYGGGQDTEDAVSLALVWIARHQLASGLWSLTGEDKGNKARYSKGSSYENNEAATAMALLAFLGAGHTHKSPGEYGKVIDRGVQALLRLQDVQGNFFRGPRADDALYSQAQCTMALCELYALTKDSALKDPCTKAVKYCLDAQDPNLGGWRYRPRSDSDTSVTGWMVMALHSARNAGIDVPQASLDLVSSYLDKAARGTEMLDARTTIVTTANPGVTKPEAYGSRYSYQPGMPFDRVMTAEGLLCRMYLGWSHDDPRLITGCEQLLDHLPTWPDRDVYFWYYATQTMFHMEGRFWKQWNDAQKDMLVFRQEKTGPERGSWDPLDNEGPDLWSLNKHGGRLYVTCFSVFMLEVYYRHLPLYSDLKKQMEKK